jgi:hypothetical protein
MDAMNMGTLAMKLSIASIPEAFYVISASHYTTLNLKT